MSMGSPSASCCSSSGPSGGGDDAMRAFLRPPTVSTGLADPVTMTRLPVLSLITWAPFVGALLIMFTARHRPLAVRLIAAVTTGVSAVLSLWIYIAYDREATGFQFYEKVPLVPPLGVSYEL